MAAPWHGAVSHPGTVIYRSRRHANTKLIALIDDGEVIEKILRHLDLWPEESIPARAPPEPIIQDYIIEPFFDDMPLEAAQ